MTEQNWEKKTDPDLVEEAYHGHTSQGAVVEMMRRLKDVLSSQQQATNKLTKRIYWLTLWLLIVAAVTAPYAIVQMVRLVQRLWAQFIVG